MFEPGLEQLQQAKISWELMNRPDNLHLWVVQNWFIYQRSFCPGKLNMVWHPREAAKCLKVLWVSICLKPPKLSQHLSKIFLLFMDGSWQEVPNSAVLFVHAPWESAARRQSSQSLLRPILLLMEKHQFSRIQLRSHGKIPCFHHVVSSSYSFFILHRDLLI